MAGKKWTPEELELLKVNYATVDWEQLKQLFPNRSIRSIECTASRMGIEKPSKSWSEEEVSILRQYYPVSTPQEIAVLLPQRNNQTITRTANKLGIYRENYRWTEEEDQVLYTYYGSKTVKDLVKLLPNHSNNGIKLRARKLGLWQDKSLPYRTYSYDYSFFQVPNLTNSYYAGLLAADGSVSTVTNVMRISLKREDSYLLEQFKKDIKFTGKVKDFDDTPGVNSVIKDVNKVTPSAILCLSGAEQVVQDLRLGFNLVPNKTLILEPPNVKGENVLSFIVGYIDGDGWISLIDYKPTKWGESYGLGVGLAGTFGFLSWVKSIFDRLCPNAKRENAQVLKQKDSNIWVYKVGGFRAYKILKVLEAVKTPVRLERKWNKIKEYEQLIGV